MDIIKLVNAFKLVQNNYFSDKNYKNSMSPPSAFCPSPLSPGSIPVLARLERDLAHHNRKPKALWEHAAVKKPRDYRVIRGRGHYPSVSIIIKTFPVFLN